MGKSLGHFWHYHGPTLTLWLRLLAFRLYPWPWGQGRPNWQSLFKKGLLSYHKLILHELQENKPYLKTIQPFMQSWGVENIFNSNNGSAFQFMQFWWGPKANGINFFLQLTQLKTTSPSLLLVEYINFLRFQTYTNSMHGAAFYVQ